MEECIRSGRVNVLFNSIPVEINRDSVILEVAGQVQDVPNDFVWIFAGGDPPYDFLRRIGIQFGMRDMTPEADRESRDLGNPAPQEILFNTQSTQ
jgi:thioredoxin reductase